MRRSKGRLCRAVAAAVVSLVVGAGAQTPTQPELARITEQVAARRRVRILVDPELQAPRGLRPPAQGFSVDGDLDALCSRMSGAAWRRAYLPGRAAANPDAARLAAVARALEAIEPGHLVVHIPERAEVIRFARSPGPIGAPPPPAPGTSELFILYSTTSTSDGRTPEARVAELQRQQLALESAEEHLPLGVGQLLQLMQTLPPADMERLAGPTVAASYRLWDVTPPAQRHAMMQQTMEVMQPLLKLAKAPRSDRNGQSARPVPLVNRLPDLGRVARELAKKHGTSILLDPDLFVIARPVAPEDALPLRKALDEVVRPLAGVHWRTIQPSESLGRKLEARETAATLSAAVRTLESLEYSLVTLHDAASGNSTTYRAEPVQKATAAPEAAPPLQSAPLCLVFDASPSATGRTAEERLMSIQRQQFQEMFRMNPDQLTRSMESSMRSYETADPAAQKRLLALPMMSGMMAGWFPRQAKETGQR